MILLFQITFVFGQTNWSQWGSLPCFKGFQFAVVNNGLVQSINQYSWQAKIKSTYTQKVTFNMTWIVGGEEVSIGQVTLQPGKEYLHTSRYFNSNADILYVKVSEVNFSDKLNCYAECDNGSPNQPNCSNSNSANTSPDTSATQQNDLTEYNNSKADLERQLAEHNAGIQKQNEENSNKLNIWNNAIKAGVDAHNKGNYAEAKNQFLNAINNSTNESNRQNAQNYYDKSVDAEKDQTKIKAVGDLVQVGINGAFGIADAIKANKEHKERRDAEKKAWLLENRQKEHDEKIVKETEEKLKFDELLKEAENGNFTAQYEIAKKYGKDDEKYTISLYFYKMAYNNPNKELSEDFLIGYTDKLQQVRRIRELYDILLNKEYVSKYPLIKLKSAFFNIFIRNYFFWPSFFEGSEVQNGINQLKELIDQKTDELPALLHAFMQVTGEYEKFGVPLNEKEGLKVLKETKNLNAKYYLGLIYLNGTSSIIKDEKKAKEFFYESLDINTLMSDKNLFDKK